MKKLILIILLFGGYTFSQDLDCDVKTDYSALTVINPDLMHTFHDAVKDYMNSTEFAEFPWQDAKIKCKLDIFFLTGNNDGDFTAQVFVSAERYIDSTDEYTPLLKIFDDNWSFNYNMDQSIYSDQALFDPVASFLQYYAYIIIGYYEDSRTSLGGSNYFEKANTLTNLAMQSPYSAGWDNLNTRDEFNRQDLTDNLTNEILDPIRQAYYDYNSGIDLYAHDPIQGQKQIALAIDSIENVSDNYTGSLTILKVFFDTKYGEIIDRMSSYPNKSFFTKLISLDPAHSDEYEEVLSGKENY